MTTSTGTRFDLEGLAAAFEAGDVEKVLSYYDPKAVHFEIDADAPPKSPRPQGLDYIDSAISGAKEAGIKITLENLVVGDDRAACTITCLFPDGRKMMSNTILDVRGEKIVRQLDIQVMDPA